MNLIYLPFSTTKNGVVCLSIFIAVNHQNDPFPDRFQNLDRHLLTRRRVPPGKFSPFFLCSLSHWLGIFISSFISPVTNVICFSLPIQGNVEIKVQVQVSVQISSQGNLGMFFFENIPSYRQNTKQTI